MRAAAIMFGAAFTLAACGERTEPAAPTPAETVSAAPPVSDADAAAPAVMTLDRLRSVCQAGLAAIHGQNVADIRIDGLEGQVVNASWRAPVDGGRRQAQCRVEGDILTWRQVGSANVEQDRWMNQAGDPVTRFVLDGDRVTITQTLLNGETLSSDVGDI